jgi:hypothetical protein
MTPDLTALPRSSFVLFALGGVIVVGSLVGLAIAASVGEERAAAGITTGATATSVVFFAVGLRPLDALEAGMPFHWIHALPAVAAIVVAAPAIVVLLIADSDYAVAPLKVLGFALSAYALQLIIRRLLRSRNGDPT